MKMKKLTLLAAGLLLSSGLSVAQERHSRNTVTMNDDSPNDNCADHLRVYNDDFRNTVRDEETQTVGSQPLTITAEHNGGIQVTTWDKPEFSIKLCKQISIDDEAEGRRLLSQTNLNISGGSVSVRSPQKDDHYSLGTVVLVRAPRDAKLDLSVSNGGVSLTNFVGTATAHAQNGGISFRKSSGTLVAEAQNGGISIKDCGGDVSANVRNGGVSITVPEHWEGKGLEAHTQNGGLSLIVPKNLSTGVEVVTSEHTSIVCRDDACTNAERTWDSGHKVLRMGGPNPQIRASTVNGGIVIEEQGHKREM
jgi:hypothetical protein